VSCVVLCQRSSQVLLFRGRGSFLGGQCAPISSIFLRGDRRPCMPHAFRVILDGADETRLRAKGYDKTPDFILQVPVGE